MAQYEALPDVYEWLIPDAKLTPEGSVTALGDLVQSLPSDARVLTARVGRASLLSASPVSASMSSLPMPARGWSAGRRNSQNSTALRYRR
jgi:hypothetical protein